MKKAIYIDFDDTLYSHQQDKIPDSAIEAIIKTRRKGNLVFLCTGRCAKELTWFDLSKFEYDGMVLFNGQVGVDQNMNVLFKDPIKGILKERILKYFNEKTITTSLATLDDIFINFESEAIKITEAKTNSRIPRVDVYKGQDIYMASTFYKDKKEIEDVISDLSRYAYITSWTDAVDIVPKGASKLVGINKMNNAFNIDMKDAIGIGDGDNDIEMLEKCGIGIAMGNSTISCKKVADYITDDINKNGLYNAFVKYELL